MSVEAPPSSKSNSYLTVPGLILHDCWVDFVLPEANIKTTGSTYVSYSWFKFHTCQNSSTIFHLPLIGSPTRCEQLRSASKFKEIFWFCPNFLGAKKSMTIGTAIIHRKSFRCVYAGISFSSRGSTEP